MLSQIRDYWNNQPCNIKHSNKQFLSKEYFDEVENKKYFVEPCIPKFAKFNKWNGKKVLEIGCGIGTDSINFVRNGAILTIIEFSDKSLDICKERFKVFDLSANFYLGNAENITDIVPIEKYDLIYSYGVIHHTTYPEKIVEKLHNYCHKETEIRMMVYSKISWKLFWLLFEGQKNNSTHEVELNNLDNLIRLNSEAQYGCPVTYTYTFKEIENLFKDFNIEKIYKDHIFMYDIKEYKNGNYILDNYWKNTSEEFKEIMKNELGWHTLFIAKLKNNFKN